MLGSIGMILSFVSDPFFFSSYPLTCHLLLFVGSCKRIEDGKNETRKLLYSKLYFGVHDYSVVGMFSWISRSSHVFQTRCWNVLMSFSVRYVHQRQLLAGGTTGYQTPDPISMPAHGQQPRKKGTFNSSSNSLSDNFSFWYQGAHPIRLLWILLPLRSPFKVQA